MANYRCKWNNIENLSHFRNQFQHGNVENFPTPLKPILFMALE